MGSGKSNLAAMLLSRKWMEGFRVYASADAGFGFGFPLPGGGDDALAKLYAFAVQEEMRDCYIFIDEIGVYLDRFAQNALVHRAFVQSLAALRKNGVHLVYAAQADSQLAASVRAPTTTAFYPYDLVQLAVRPKRRRTRRQRRRREYIDRPGRYSHFKRGLTVLKGTKALTWDEVPTRAMILQGKEYARPKMYQGILPYEHLVFAAGAYNTFSELQIMAAQGIDAKKLREVGLSGRGGGKS